MDKLAIERAKARLDEASRDADPAVLEAAFERARTQIEELAELAAEFSASLPSRVTEAVHDGVRAEMLPAARRLAEVHGLVGQTIRRLERLEGVLTAERHARVEDLAVLVELVASGWQGVDRRLARLERIVTANGHGRADAPAEADAAPTRARLAGNS